MHKLLTAGLFRFSRSILFWLSPIAAIVCGILCGANLDVAGIDDIYILAIFIHFAIIISLSVGREQFENVQRNKIAVGYTKGEFFLSELILHVGICALLTLLFTASFAIVGARLLSHIPGRWLCKMAFGFVLSCVSISVLQTVICELISYRGVGPILCILLVLGLSSGAAQIDVLLAEEETYTINHGIDVESAEEIVRQNPNYVREPYRAILQFTNQINPCSLMYQCDQLSYYYIYDYEYEENDIWLIQEKAVYENAITVAPLYLTGSIVLVSAVGYSVFRRKDLK